jgi:hypothetical protein
MTSDNEDLQNWASRFLFPSSYLKLKLEVNSACCAMLIAKNLLSSQF